MNDHGFIFASDVPLHHQVYELVRADIVDGLYVGCNAFPGEAELARRFGVSVTTSRMVLQRLTTEGLLTRGRGRRSQAVFRAEGERVTPLIGNRDVFTFEILKVDESAAPWAACRALRLPAGSSTWRCIRLRYVDGRRHSVTFHYQPSQIGRLHKEQEIAATPMPQLLAAAGFPTIHTDCIIGIRRPPVAVSAALKVDIWNKVLIATLTSVSENERVSEFARIFFHPDEQNSLSSIAGGASLDLG